MSKLLRRPAAPPADTRRWTGKGEPTQPVCLFVPPSRSRGGSWFGNTAWTVMCSRRSKVGHRPTPARQDGKLFPLGSLKLCGPSLWRWNYVMLNPYSVWRPSTCAVLCSCPWMSKDKQHGTVFFSRFLCTWMEIEHDIIVHEIFSCTERRVFSYFCFIDDILPLHFW